jgi:hypothetical protein
VQDIGWILRQCSVTDSPALQPLVFQIQLEVQHILSTTIMNASPSFFLSGDKDRVFAAPSRWMPMERVLSPRSAIGRSIDPKITHFPCPSRHF